MDKSKAICSINGSLEDSFDAFIANLYRIFHCATVSSIPPLERFKYLYFTDELIHEQFRELHRNDDSVLPDLCNHFRATRCRYTNCCSRQPPECNLLFRQ